MSARHMAKKKGLGRTRITAQQVTALRRKHPGKWPCDILADLRDRAELTQQNIVDYAKDSDGSKKWTKAVSYGKYEQPRYMHNDLIPNSVIEALIPVLKGRGSPPIELQEIVKLSNAKRLSDLVEQRTSDGNKTRPQLEVSPVFPRKFESVKFVSVRYRAERGVWMEDQQVGKRDDGVATFLAAEDIRGDQAACVVGDDHAEPHYLAGTTLHVAAVDNFSMEEIVGKRVLLRVPRGDSGLAEVVLGKIVAMNGNKPIICDLEDNEIEGNLEAVVIGSYRRE